MPTVFLCAHSLPMDELASGTKGSGRREPPPPVRRTDPRAGRLLPAQRIPVRRTGAREGEAPADPTHRFRRCCQRMRFIHLDMGKNGLLPKNASKSARRACQEKKKGDYKFISLQSPKPGTGRVVFRRPVEGGPTVHLSPQTSANVPFSNKRKPAADDNETLC